MNNFEDIIIEEKKGCKILKLPINSSKKNMQNKKCDYRILGLMTLYSNRTPSEISLDEGYEEIYRYIYKNKIEDNMEEIEILTNNKRDTIIRNIKKLAKSSNGLIIATNSPNGICYYIHYAKDNNYVIIEEDILKTLVNATNSNVIKVYLLLKYLCRNECKEIHRAYIAEQVGLSTNRNNLRIISDITYVLERLKLIKVKREYKTILLDNGKEQYTQVNKYEVCTYDEYIKQKNKN